MEPGDSVSCSQDPATGSHLIHLSPVSFRTILIVLFPFNFSLECRYLIKKVQDN
jgi:hypothetical protein